MPAIKQDAPLIERDEQHRRPVGEAGLRYVAILCAMWLALASLEVCLMFLLPGSAVHAREFFPLERLSIAAYDLEALAIFVSLLGAPVCLLANPIVSLARHKLLRVLARVLLMMFVGGFLFLCGVSWGSFWSVGSFLDREGFAFWVPQPIQVFHWVHPRLLYGMPPVLLVTTLILARWLPSRIARLHTRELRRICIVTLSLITLCLFLSRVGRPDSSRAAADVNAEVMAIPLTFGQHYHETRRRAAGAFAHGRMDIEGWLFDNQGEVSASRRIGVVRRPIISMDDYLGRVDREKIRRMNVMVILVESMRPDELEVYGGSAGKMPSVDSLAAESIVFKRASAHATHTNYAAPCPLSSHYPLRSSHTHLYPDNPLYPRVMIYDLLKAAGYRVGLFSSGNENWGGLFSYLNTGSVDKYHHAESWEGPTYVAETDSGFAKWVAHTKHAGSVDDRYTAQEAINWIGQETQSIKDARPFFLYMLLQSSHFPYVVPDDFPRPFGPEKIDFTMAFNNYPRNRVPVVKSLYADSLNYIDQQLAKVFEHLKSRGLWDNTIVVLSGDHGQAFYEHGFSAHGNMLYNELLRVPLVVRVPGMEPSISDLPAQHIDVPPSILHLLGLPLHPGHQGLNLFAPGIPENRARFSVVQTPLAHQYAVVRGDYKLIYDLRQDAYALYDLVQDAHETRNLSHEKPELLQNLKERLDTWRAVQIEYYSNRVHQTTWYPPVLSEE